MKKSSFRHFIISNNLWTIKQLPNHYLIDVLDKSCVILHVAYILSFGKVNIVHDVIQRCGSTSPDRAKLKNSGALREMLVHQYVVTLWINRVKRENVKGHYMTAGAWWQFENFFIHPALIRSMAHSNTKTGIYIYIIYIHKLVCTNCGWLR